MALRDLVADHRKIAEETIENMVAPYVRYDPAAYKIVWTPQGRSLGNEAQILVFLVAVLGWQYVSDEAREVGTKPADLEAELGIPGGSLRPSLKKLKDSHLLAAVDGHYRVQLANLDCIYAVIRGETKRPGNGRAHKKKGFRTAKRREADGTERDPVRSTKKNRGSSDSLKTYLANWVTEGIFNEPRTLANLLERYHEHGVIAKQTSLSGLMLEAVREGILARTKIDVRGKQVWAYRAKGP